MKKILLLTALSAVIMTGCQTANTGFQVPVATAQLEKAISDVTKDDSTYQLAYADLNRDGIDDALVLLEGSNWCGSGGCTLLVFEGIENGNFKLNSKSTVASATIYVIEQDSTGWSDLSVYSKGTGQVMMKWGGSNYPSNPSLQPTLIIDSKVIKPVISVNVPQ